MVRAWRWRARRQRRPRRALGLERSGLYPRYMGQTVGIVERRRTGPGVLRWELDRSLTGMGHEAYSSSADTAGRRPPDELAARLFSTGPVASVHIFSNVVTVTLLDGAPVDAEALDRAVSGLFVHYEPGVLPTPIDVTAALPAEATA